MLNQVLPIIYFNLAVFCVLILLLRIRKGRPFISNYMNNIINWFLDGS